MHAHDHFARLSRAAGCVSPAKPQDHILSDPTHLTITRRELEEAPNRRRPEMSEYGRSWMQSDSHLRQTSTRSAAQCAER